MKRSLIVAIDQGGCIGKDGSIPWHLPEDMKFFSQTTKGKVVIMGKKTWFSLPSKFRPLPNRINIVVSSTLLSDKTYTAPDGVVIVESLETAWMVAKALNADEAVVIGGVGLYREALSQVDTIYYTLVYGFHKGDTHLDISKEVNTFDASRTVLENSKCRIVEYTRDSSK